jgi:hypothetical protein
MPNKANFRKPKNEHNSLFYNDYEQKTTNYELLKTNPNKAKSKPISTCYKGRKAKSNPIYGEQR